MLLFSVSFLLRAHTMQTVEAESVTEEIANGDIQNIPKFRIETQQKCALRKKKHLPYLLHGVPEWTNWAVGWMNRMNTLISIWIEDVRHRFAHAFEFRLSAVARNSNSIFQKYVCIAVLMLPLIMWSIHSAMIRNRGRTLLDLMRERVCVINKIRYDNEVDKDHGP